MKLFPSPVHAPIPAAASDTIPSNASGPRQGFRPRAGVHIAALDGVRGVAILLVLITHFLAPFSWAARNHREGRGWILAHLFDAGWVGVDLFFVLSGFLITRILADAKGNEHYFRNFYMRRSLRVFPLYYGVLIVTCLLIPLFGLGAIEPGKQSWLWTYGLSLYPMFTGAEFRLGNDMHLLFTHFWSLAVEEHFYLVWPLLVCFMRRKALMRLCVGLCVLAFCARVVCVKLGAATPVMYEVTFLRMDGMLAGSWAALAIRGPLGIAPLATLAWRGLFAAGAVLAAVGVYAHGMTRANRVMQTVGFSALAVFFACAVLLIVARPKARLVSGVLGCGALRWLGKYSYGLYVYHGLLLPMFDRVWFPVPTNLPLTSPAFIGALAWHVLASTAVSVVLAVVSYHLFEKQFLKLKRFFPGAVETSQAPSVPRNPTDTSDSTASIPEPALRPAPRRAA